MRVVFTPHISIQQRRVDKVGLREFLPILQGWLILDCYTALQRAETIIHSFLVMAKAPIIAWNFCCHSREASLIEIFGTLIRRGVSCLNTTEQENIVSRRSQAFSLGIVFSPEATETPN